jgi:hypothetical protein
VNIQTGEKLVITIDIERMGEDDRMTVTISRYPMEANEEWIKAMEEEPYNKYRYITIEI